MPKIFISYRRDDTAAEVPKIANELAREFGMASVYFDFESIQHGDDFPASIQSAIDSASVMLVLIGRDWIDARFQDAKPDDPPRLWMPDDWVAAEIRMALSKGLKVIPVLIGAEMPKAEQLPPGLRKLCDLQAAEISERANRPQIQALVDTLRARNAPFAAVSVLLSRWQRG